MEQITQYLQEITITRWSAAFLKHSNKDCYIMLISDKCDVLQQIANDCYDDGCWVVLMENTFSPNYWYEYFEQNNIQWEHGDNVDQNELEFQWSPMIFFSVPNIDAWFSSLPK